MTIRSAPTLLGHRENDGFRLAVLQTILDRDAGLGRLNAA